MQAQEAGHTTVQVARLIPVPVGLALPVRVGLDMPDLAVPHTTALAALFIVGLVGLHLNRLGAQRIQGLAGRVTQGLAGRATRGRVERGEGVLRSADERRDAMRLVLCLLMALIAVPSTASPLTDCNDWASEANKNYPMTVDRFTVITGAMCYPDGGRVVWRYMAKLNFTKQQVTSASIAHQKSSLKNGLCSMPDMRSMLKLVDMEYFYVDSNSIFVFSTKIRNQDCK